MKYRPQNVEKVLKLAQQGATDQEMADEFGCAVSTLYRWRNTHPAFAEAMRVGKDHANERVKRSLYQRAVGYDATELQAVKLASGSGKDREEHVEIVAVTKHIPADVKAAQFWLTNRDTEEWKNRQTKEVSEEHVHVFRLPDNGRDNVKHLHPPTIEGEKIEKEATG